MKKIFLSIFTAGLGIISVSAGYISNVEIGKEGKFSIFALK
jgi:hypothetical protein